MKNLLFIGIMIHMHLFAGWRDEHEKAGDLCVKDYNNNLKIALQECSSDREFRAKMKGYAILLKECLRRSNQYKPDFIVLNQKNALNLERDSIK